MRLAVIAAALAAARVAAADPPGLTPLVEPAQPAAHTADARDPAIGTALALAGTALPIVIVAGYAHNNGDPANALLAFTISAVVAPSAGHWYAGELGGIGMGIRAAGAVLFVSAVASADGGNNAETQGWLSLGILATGAIYDIYTSGDAVRDWNKAHARVQPTVVPFDRGYGVGLGGRF
jgi:hypothetical protein